jgi:ubiquitin carboxyl-terminal hydrolase 9/24
VKKETKWPNGQVHTVESEQFANALMLFYEKVKPSPLPTDEADKEEKDEGANRRKLADQNFRKTSGYDAFEPDVKRSNATHKWQTFLFDSEFQIFLKGLLGLCRLSRSQKDRIQFNKSSDGSLSWQSSILDMLLAFFLDVLLYSGDKASLGTWTSMLCDTLSFDQESSKHFVLKLARRTYTVSANWLRTYIAECPDQDSRLAAVRIFAVAIRSCAAIPDEEATLVKWIQAWQEQLNSYKDLLGKAPLPSCLKDSWQILEDYRTLGTPRSSIIGTIISHINKLLDVAPRTWRYNSELCALIRDIANGENEAGGSALRSALNESHVPSRLICLVARDKASSALRISFPGPSMSFETADSQARPETNASSHLLPMSSSHMMANDIHNRGPSSGVPVASDFLTLFEALVTIIGMKGLIMAPIVFEAAEHPRGRSGYVLTEEASNALSMIYQESCSSSGAGMSQQDIERYLQICGLDSSSVPTQKILDILTKYPSTNGDSSRSGAFHLSLEGFLAYYRDTAQTNEARVRSDLHTFGFRPDLSRRVLEARIDTVDGQPSLRPTVESVCLDVSTFFSSGEMFEDLGALALYGLNNFDVHAYAYLASEPLAEYLLAMTSIDRDTTGLITNTQRAIYRAPSAWAGNETWAAATMIFRVLVCLHDSYQQGRIARIMENTRGDMNDQGIGLLQACKVLLGSRSNQNYSNEMQYAYERYIELMRELMTLKPVASWLTENRALWSWLERDLVAIEEAQPQRRSDYSGRREGVMMDNPRSDSDMHGVPDSEDDDDDDDSRMYDDGHRFRDEKIVISGAGLDAINGIYHRDGEFDGVGKYTRKGTWKGMEEAFSLFRCNVSNNTSHWYISIVPVGVQPGTNTDIDFYSAPVNPQNPNLPPIHGWTKANEGIPPSPVVEVRHDDENEEQQRMRGMA